MGTVCGAYGKLDKTNGTLQLKNLKGRDNLGDLGIDVRKIVKQIKKTGLEGVDWIHLGQEREGMLGTRQQTFERWRPS
jgi:hypothetical protein